MIRTTSTKSPEGVRSYGESKIDETLPPIEVSAVTPEEIRAIDAFLTRRDSLDAVVRTTMVHQICERLTVKLNLAIYGRPRRGRLLETVKEQWRQSNRFRG